MKWCKTWGAKLSSRKTKGMIFTHRQNYTSPTLKIENLDIEILQSFTFLGMVFDSRLTWKPHIDNVAMRCMKRINVLKSLAGSDWGSDTSSLLLLFRTLIRPILDYGCEVYDTAKHTIKRKLDSVQLNALKVCSGTTFFTSLAALQTECGEMPLELRRYMISSKHRAKLESFPTNHPIREPISSCWQYDLLDFKDEIPFVQRSPLPPGNVESRLLPHIEVPPWHMPTPSVSTALHDEIEKKNTPPPVMHSLSLNIIYEKWNQHTHVYTDGSKDQNQNTSAAVYIPKHNVNLAMKTTPISIFRAEQLAIIMALEWIIENNPESKYVIFCDSLSVLIDLKELNSSHFTLKIRNLLFKLNQPQTQVHFEWIPSHCGIKGNDQVDTLAKHALERDNEIEIPQSVKETNTSTYNYHMEKWQSQWTNSQRGRFLYHVQPSIRPPFKSTLHNRRDENILHRLRVGSCLLNETLFKLGKHSDGKCPDCNAPETVQHFLLDCNRYKEYRSELQSNLGVAKLSIRNILNNREQRHLIHYVKQTDKYWII